MKALYYFTPNFITLLVIIIVTDIKYNIAIITNLLITYAKISEWIILCNLHNNPKLLKWAPIRNDKMGLKEVK